MARLALALTAVASLIGASPAAGFVSTSARATVSTRPSIVFKAATFRGDTFDVDYDRARECAESFGECTIEDLERMRNGGAFVACHSLCAEAWPASTARQKILHVC
jgi:hypothetical protein